MAYNLERRQSPRKRFENLLYVEIEPGNGGMVLNFSEHGFGFRAVKRVRPKEEVKFAFNLDEKRRLEGRGCVEWADKEGRVAGVQFTDVSEEFLSEMRTWLATSPEAASRLAKKPAPPAAPVSVPSMDPPQSAGWDRPVSPRSRDSLARSVSVKSVRSISSITSNSAPSPPPDLSAESFTTENVRAPDPESMPWAAMLPPAVGAERKPTISMRRQPAAAELAGSTAHKLDPRDVERSDREPSDQRETEEDPYEQMASSAEKAASTPVRENPVVAAEARTTEALNEHAQALLQHFQHEEQKMLATFRESAARVLRESDRQLFPIREAVQAQLKSLESSVAAAGASAKVLDQYPALLERAQQQALERFQAQVQEVMRTHVMELRRRSELALEEANLHAHHADLLPGRIRTSSGIVVTVILVLLLAGLFAFRSQVAGAFIWLGQRMVEPAPVSESANSATPQVAETKPKEQPQPTVQEVIPAPKTGTPVAAPSPKDVRTLWNEVATGDVSAELTLGTMYFTGHGVTKNCFQARRLFTAAAKKGSAEGKQKLAELENAGCS